MKYIHVIYSFSKAHLQNYSIPIADEFAPKHFDAQI